MPKEYLTYVRQFADINEGERELFIKDLTPGPRKYDSKHVRARITLAQASGSDTLLVRSELGALHPQRWAIEILEELPPYVVGEPWTDVFAALRGG